MQPVSPGHFDYPLNFNIERNISRLLMSSGTPLEVPDETGSFMIDEHHILDLEEAIRQNALLAVPMKPLCEDCAGLYPLRQGFESRAV
jgi:uncharacterized protein